VNILFLTTVLPGKKRNGGEIVSQYLIDALRQNSHQVLVLGYTPRGGSYQVQLDEISVGERYIETELAKYYPLIWMLFSYLKGIPYSTEKYYSKVYETKVAELLAQSHYDTVIVDHAQIGWLKNILPSKQTKLIFNTHNIEHEIYLEQLQKTTNPILKQIYQREARLVKVLEDRLAVMADRIWTLTANDAAYFASVTSIDRLKVFNVPVNEVIFADRVETSFDVGMVGTWTWQPNKEGLQWFFEFVYPFLPTTLSISIAGKGADWLRDKYPNVQYCGFVPDPQAFIAQAKVVAIPSITGGGIQLKTLEAIAAGASILATPTALRGIADYPKSVRVATTPTDFARQLIELIAIPTIDGERRAAIDWSRRRREQFCRDVGAAICD
jgi:polysaccharide biosynthesis protein PslH